MAVRVGTDLVAVATVEAAVREHGDRYLERVFTARELADLGGAAAAPERLAARFAAKEAAIKVLRPGRDDPVPWGDIEVRRDPGGWTELVLGGHAARLADAAGVTSLAVSLTHEGGWASAVVVAEVGASGR